MSPDKRRYHSNLGFIEQGFRACWQNAQDLIACAKSLNDAGMHAPALSLSVLALEELGKLMALDGLLFARHDDSRSKYFKDSSRSHETKLGSIALFPLFLGSLMASDPRCGNDPAYAQANVSNIRNLQQDVNAILARLGNEGFRGLDKYKQCGFYVSTTSKGLQAPRNNVDPKLAEMVYTLAWRSTTSVDVLLKEGNLERYIQQARNVRSKLTEAGHKELEQLGEEHAERLFGELQD